MGCFVGATGELTITGFEVLTGVTVGGTVIVGNSVAVGVNVAVGVTVRVADGVAVGVVVAVGAGTLWPCMGMAKGVAQPLTDRFSVLPGMDDCPAVPCAGDQVTAMVQD